METTRLAFVGTLHGGGRIVVECSAVLTRQVSKGASRVRIPPSPQLQQSNANRLHVSSAVDLAWAAGLFDAEGSVYTWRQAARRAQTWRTQREMAVSQAGDGGVPEVLLRFREVVDRGNLRGPVRGYLYYWYSARQDEIDEISALVWPWLADEKRKQFRVAAAAVDRLTPDAARVQSSSRREEFAWAAGFFEGEGTIRARDGYPELALGQATHDGAIPNSLLKFQRTMGGLGWIMGPIQPSNPWSKLPQFVWGSARFEHVQCVIAALWPWLSSRRRDEARRALGAKSRRARI